MFLGFPGKPVATPPSTLSPVHHCVALLSLHFLFLPPPLTRRVGSPQLRRFLHCSGVSPGRVGSPGRSCGRAGRSAGQGTGSCRRLCAADRCLSVPSVPAENPAASLIIGQEDFQRIKAAARVLTKEEREAKLAALKVEKEAIHVGISPPAPSFPACWPFSGCGWRWRHPGRADLVGQRHTSRGCPGALFGGHHIPPSFAHVLVRPRLPRRRAGAACPGSPLIPSPGRAVQDPWVCPVHGWGRNPTLVVPPQPMVTLEL